MLNSDSDPATPVSNGYAVFQHAKNASMVTMQGGPHVIFGRGLGCPDSIVFGLMLDGRKPERSEQVCRQEFLDRYTPLTMPGDAFALARGVEADQDQRGPEIRDPCPPHHPIWPGCRIVVTTRVPCARITH